MSNQIELGGMAAVDALTAEPEGRVARWKKVLLGFLAVLLLIAVGLDIYYMITKKPLTEMPVAAAKAVPPSYVTSFYGMTEPMGVAVSPDAQRMYVSEGAGDHLIRAYDRTGRELFNFAPDPDPARRGTLYMSVDSKGQLYAADMNRRRVSIYNPDGSLASDLQPPAEAPFSAPLSVTVDRSSNLFITDAGKDGHSVIVLDPQGKLLRRLDGTSGDQVGLSFPQQAVTDSRGRIYVSNGNAGRVEVFAADGKYSGPLAKGTNPGAVGLPRGIAVDGLDRLYVVDAIAGAVQVFDVSGEKPAYLFAFGTTGIDDGAMLYPVGIAVDSTGRIYIADRINSRVQIWTY